MDNQRIEIVILCGGPGIRMGKLTLKRQKCMLEVESRSMLEHIFETIINAFGNAKVTLVIGHRDKDIRNYFGGSYKSLQLEYTKKSTKGTRLALLTSQSFVRGKLFLLMDGDIIVKADELAKLVNMKKSNLLGRIFVSTRHEIASTHGLAVVKNHCVTRIIYPPESVFEAAVFRLMDIGFYSRKLFEYSKSYDVPTVSEVLKNSIEDGKIVEARVYKNNWFHFVKPNDLQVSIKF